MQHFFADPSCVDGEQIRLAGSDVNHMKNVLRMKSGEEVWVSDGEGMDYFCSVEGYEEKEAVLRVVKKEVSQTELASRLILFQGLPKGDKMEWIVQKAVELGAYSIVFQDVTLFDNTIMENIRIGKKDATDEEVIRAAKEAQCCAVCGKALRCETGSEESRKEERTLAGNCQGGCGTIEERNCATSAGCDELSGSDELRERAGCSACSL